MFSVGNRHWEIMAIIIISPFKKPIFLKINFYLSKIACVHNLRSKLVPLESQ